MGMPNHADARLYYRVAYQRLEEGQLLERLGQANASIYLTGYAVECILKALLLTVTAVGKRPEAARMFRGSRGHDLLWLHEQLRVRKVLPPCQVREDLLLVSTWSTELRYEPGPGDLSEARRFMSATKRIVDWAKGRM